MDHTLDSDFAKDIYGSLLQYYPENVVKDHVWQWLKKEFNAGIGDSLVVEAQAEDSIDVESKVFKIELSELTIVRTYFKYYNFQREAILVFVLAFGDVVSHPYFDYATNSCVLEIMYSGYHKRDAISGPFDFEFSFHEMRYFESWPPDFE